MDIRLPLKHVAVRCALFLLAVSCIAASTRANFGDELFKLTASDSADGDRFGQSVAISGSLVAVGRGNSISTSAPEVPGAVHIFDLLTGEELFKYYAADASPKDGFGGSVAISGTTAIIGAINNADAGPRSGAAYLFDITTGEQLFKLTPSDAGASDAFGISVAISGNLAVVGASQLRIPFNVSGTGAAYVFDVRTGQQLYKLTASDAEPEDRFGISVAISGNIAVIGADFNDDAGSRSGSAYLFDVTTGQEVKKLTASDAAANDLFGSSVAISGNTAIISAYRNDDAGIDSGSAYLFDVMTGAELRKLTASDGEPQAIFGTSVAISRRTAIVGAIRNGAGEGGTHAGSAYLFDVETGVELLSLHGTAVASEAFGVDVAISDSVAIVGAPSYLPTALFHPLPGSAYLFDVSRDASIRGDYNNNGTVDAADYIVWRNTSGQAGAGLAADGNGDGRVDAADYDLWRANFGQTAASGAAAGVSGSVAVPEPATVYGLALAISALFIRRSSAAAAPSSTRRSDYA